TACWRTVEAGALSYGTGTPYLPLRRLLQAYFHVDDRDDPSAIRDKVTDRLLALDSRFAELVAPILALLDIPVEDAHWAALDPPQRRLQINHAPRRVLPRERQNQPVLLVLEH